MSYLRKKISHKKYKTELDQIAGEYKEIYANIASEEDALWYLQSYLYHNFIESQAQTKSREYRETDIISAYKKGQLDIIKFAIICRTDIMNKNNKAIEKPKENRVL